MNPLKLVLLFVMTFYLTVRAEPASIVKSPLKTSIKNSTPANWDVLSKLIILGKMRPTVMVDIMQDCTWAMGSIHVKAIKMDFPGGIYEADTYYAYGEWPLFSIPEGNYHFEMTRTNFYSAFSFVGFCIYSGNSSLTGGFQYLASFNASTSFAPCLTIAFHD